MKKILFDLTATQPSGDSKRHGGGKYGEIVLQRIVELGYPIDCYYDSKKWINPDILTLVNKGTLYDLSSMTLDDIVTASGVNTIFSALPSVELYKYERCKLVGTIHGLRRLETPPESDCLYYKSSGWKDYAAFIFHLFFPNLYKNFLCYHKKEEWSREGFFPVTVSNHTANALKVYFPSFRDLEIPIFYSPSTSSDDINLKKKYCNKYFLLVSANRPEKNNLKAIKALDYLFNNGFLNDFSVKIAGMKDRKNLRYAIANKDKFEFLGYVDDFELEQLYHDAYCLIYPSLNEGFGYPPLEAMHYGVPVVASPFTSISEICQGAAIYFNPHSVEEIASRLLYISNSVIRQKYSELAYIRYTEVTKQQNDDLDNLVNYIYRISEK